jgi:PKD repeat protein
MKKRLSILICFTLIISTLISVLTTAQGNPSEKIPVMVEFKGKVDAGLIRAHGGDIKHQYGIISAVACSLPQAAIDALERNPKIANIELDGKVHATEIIPWGVDRIDAEIVHSYNEGTGVNVAIIDTGIDYNHPDLDDNYKGGYDFVNDDGDPMDDRGHGTHCAGIVAAEYNSIGVLGVAPQAYLYAVKVLDDTGSGWVSDIIAGIDWSVNNGVQIISMSLGSDYPSTSLKDACDAAYNSGLLLVAAAGNDYYRRGKTEINTVDYPARYDSVIAVGATDNTNKKASWSSTGSALELAAPGVSITSTYWDDTYATASGTSMACPHVVGTAALVWAGEPTLTNVQVRNRLRDTTNDLGSVGWDSWYGWGLVDADEAAPLTGPVSNQLPVADAGSDQTALINEPLTFDGSNSYDPDGTIFSYSWDFGDEASGSGVGVTHSYSAAGTYTVTLTVEDDEGSMDTDTAIVKIFEEPPPLPTLHVASIDMSLKRAGRNTNAIATATIVATDGNPVEGAMVYGHWEVLTTDSDSGITNINGQVSLQSDKVKRAIPGTTFTFEVDNVELNGWIYNPTANVETIDSISV